jgi:hypothetical protein
VTLSPTPAVPSCAGVGDKVTDDLDSNLLLEGERSGGGNVIPLILVFEVVKGLYDCIEQDESDLDVDLGSAAKDLVGQEVTLKALRVWVTRSPTTSTAISFSRERGVVAVMSSHSRLH